MKPRIISISLGIFTFLFFTQLVSNGTYAVAPFLLSLLASGILSVCITQAIANFKSFYHIVHMNELEAEEITDGYRATPFVLSVSFLAFIFVFYFTHKHNVDKEMAEFGVTGVAEIIDGTHLMTTRRRTTTDSYQLKLQFTDQKGVKQIVFADVDSDVWNNVGRNMKVPIIYSSKNIQFIKIIVDINTYMNEYKKKAEETGQRNMYEDLLNNENTETHENAEIHACRNVNVGDLMALDTLTNTQLLEKLNSISNTWESQIENSVVKYINTKRGEIVSKNSKGVNLAVFHSDSTCQGIEPLKYVKYIGFKDVSKDTSAKALLRIYEHDDYTLTVKAEKHPTIYNSFVMDYKLVRKNHSLTAR